MNIKIYFVQLFSIKMTTLIEQVTKEAGFEPATTVLKTVILPLNYSFYRKDFNNKEIHLKKSINLLKSVVGSYNLYLIILGKKKEPTKQIKNHHKYVKLNENL